MPPRLRSSIIPPAKSTHTTYYPYGEPTVEPTGQRFLFGGKEREHAAARNTYDFSARCLTPYGNWNVIDPKADDFYSVSPYSYCGGDPINFIDPDGMEINTFFPDSTMAEFANNYPDDDFINIVSHGNPKELIYKSDGDKEHVTNTNRFIELINDNFSTANGDIQSSGAVEIRLIACSTGQDWDENTPSIAQKFSEELGNAIIYAPDCKLGLNSDGTMVKKVDGKKDSCNIPWRIFFQGNEVQPKDIEAIKKQINNNLFYNSQLNSILLKIELKRPHK